MYMRKRERRGGEQRKMKKYSNKKKGERKKERGEGKTHRLFIPLTSIPRMAKEPSH